MSEVDQTNDDVYVTPALGHNNPPLLCIVNSVLNQCFFINCKLCQFLIQ